MTCGRLLPPQVLDSIPSIKTREGGEAFHRSFALRSHPPHFKILFRDDLAKLSSVGLTTMELRTWSFITICIQG